MAQKKFTFTDLKLSTLFSRKGQRLLCYDKKQPGLAIMVTDKGSRSFKFRTWDSTRKKSVTTTIGTYPQIDIPAARDIARGLANDVANGIDIIDRQHERRQVPTLNEAFDSWVEKKEKKGKTSWTYDKLRYDKHIRPQFGNKQVTDLSKKALESWFINMPGKSNLSPTSSNRILVIVKTVFNQELPQYDNPCNGIILNKEQSRDRFLNSHEIPAFFESMAHQDTPEYLRDYIMISLYTGARKANVLGMRWQDIDLNLGIWMIPAKKSKNRTGLTIPLIPETISILERRKHVNKQSKIASTFVFPSVGTSRSKTGHLTDPRLSWNKLLERAKVENFHIHDLRRTLGSWQTMTGTSLAIVGKTLGHKSEESTRVYARMDLDAIRASMETAVNAIHASHNFSQTSNN